MCYDAKCMHHGGSIFSLITFVFSSFFMYMIIKKVIIILSQHCHPHGEPTVESAMHTFRMPNDTSTWQTMVKSMNALSGRYMPYIVLHIIGDCVFYQPQTVWSEGLLWYAPEASWENVMFRSWGLKLIMEMSTTL